MAKVRHNAGDDLKVRLQMRIGGLEVSPKEVPWEALVWVGSRQMGVRGGWDGEKATGAATVNDEYALISADAPEIGSGSLKCEIELRYPDAQQPDRDMKVTKSVELMPWEDADVDGEATGWVDHTVVGLGAYDEAVKRGFVGTVEEWLASLNGKDAEIESQTEDAEGNTVITWADGKTTTVKRGKEGRPGEPGQDGKDGGINIPRFYVDEGEDGRKHLYCEVPEAGDIRVYTKEVEGRNHLILEF